MLNKDGWIVPDKSLVLYAVLKALFSMIYGQVYPFVLIKFDRRFSGRKMEFKGKSTFFSLVLYKSLMNA